MSPDGTEPRGRPRKHKIVYFLTGKAGGYDALVPTLRGIRSYRNLKLIIAPTDQHLFESHGLTVERIRKDFPTSIIKPLNVKPYGNKAVDRCIALSELIGKVSHAIRNVDFVLLIGDRLESLYAAIAAHNMRRCIIHIQGGDRTGGVDDAQRFAISQFAHVHLVSSQESADRLIARGEDESRVYVTGDPHVDRITLGRMSDSSLRKKYLYEPWKPYVIVMLHSDTLYPELARKQAIEVAGAILDCGIQTIWVHACTDQGWMDTRAVVDRHTALQPQITKHEYIPAEDFMMLLNHAQMIIGNSSAGVIEAPYMATWTLNLGTRQQGRPRCPSIVDLPIQRVAIRRAVTRFWEEPCKRFSPYGPGDFWKRVPALISSLELTPALLDKGIE